MDDENDSSSFFAQVASSSSLTAMSNLSRLGQASVGGSNVSLIACAQCTHRGRTLYFLGPFRDLFEVRNNPGGVGLDGPRNLAGPRPVEDTPETYDPPKMVKKNFFRTCNIFRPKVHPKLRHGTEKTPPPILVRGVPQPRSDIYKTLDMAHIKHYLEK